MRHVAPHCGTVYPFRMNPQEALAQTERQADTSSAVEADSWLRNPVRLESRKTLAQLLAEEPEWTGPEWDGDEADDEDNVESGRKSSDSSTQAVGTDEGGEQAEQV
jgi:hypothetical protein